MSDESDRFHRFVILADESAGSEIAGVRQLDRLALALNGLADSTIDVVIFWRPDIAPADRWLPSDSRLTRLRLSDDVSLLKSGDPIITTRLLVDRQGLEEYLRATTKVELSETPTYSWLQLQRELEASSLNASAGHEGWKYLRDRSAAHGSGALLLRRSGKSQDGIVSRFINRPLTRPVSLLLLDLPVTPTAWTLAIFVLPLVSFVFLWRGTYANIVIGSLLYQLYSMLDGCDGEIARAKYLESERGGRIDSYCDMIGGFLFVVGLGLGLSRVSYPHTGLYAAEGALSVILVTSHESLLRRSKQQVAIESSELTGALYSRHRQMIEQSGVIFLGEKFVWWILQLSKRDVIILGFLALAVSGFAPWILHYSVFAGAVGLWLSGRSYLMARSRAAS